MLPNGNEELGPTAEMTLDVSLVKVEGEQLPTVADDQVLMNLEARRQNADPEQYHRDPCFEQGDWYINASGAIYIVPDDRLGLAEIYGPDDKTLQGLNDFYRKAEKAGEKDWFDYVDTLGACLEMGLMWVYPWQRRFDSQRGWFVA